MAGHPRQIKHDFFLNEEIARLPYEWRLLFIGLWTIADREGRIEDRPARIKAALFAYDDRVEIEVGLALLTDARLITRYEANGVRVIAIPTWKRHQSPVKSEAISKLSGPPGQPLRGVDPGGSVVRDLPLPAGGAENDAEKTPPAPPEVGTYPPDLFGTSTGSKRTCTDVRTSRERFEQFWAAYPRKVGKEAAWAVWEQLKPSDALTGQIVAAVERQRTWPPWLKDGGQFIPHPRTWLHQGRWQDEPIVPTPVTPVLGPYGTVAAQNRAFLARRRSSS